MENRPSIIGRRFDRLLVVKELKRRSRWNKRRYKCSCTCGRRVTVNRDNLLSRNTRSCGCLHRQTSAINLKRWASSAEATVLRAELRRHHKCKALKEFWNRVDKNGPMPTTCAEDFGNCWLWTGYRDKDGYGRLTIDYQDHRAPRIALLLTTGRLPQSECIMHVCDNPSCVRPNHLVPGSLADNAYDLKLKQKGAKLIAAPDPDWE